MTDPFTVVVTIPMPSRGSAEKLRDKIAADWAETPEVSVYVAHVDYCAEHEQPLDWCHHDEPSSG